MNQAAPFTIASFPSAILHIDADAFFTSVEQAVRPVLKGKAVVTGEERGMVSCASYEAKAMGVERCMPFFEAKKLCPGLIVLPGDYETYSLYSRRLFEIMRRFSPLVEEYSIDEGFSDIAGLRRIFRSSYEQIARQIQDAVRAELDITVSAGLSLSKHLAKLASRFRKPNGLTAVRGRHIHILLQRTPLAEVWGFGPNTVSLLKKHGLETAYDFTKRPESWAYSLLGKTGRETWNELRGNAVHRVTAKQTRPHTVISKCKTFTPPSRDKAFVYAVLIRNLESAFIKLRRHKLKSGLLSVFLRDRFFNQSGMEAKLGRSVSSAREAVSIARIMFERLFNDGTEYRSAMIVLGSLREDKYDQYDLFENRPEIEKLSRASLAVDEINGRFGKNTIVLAPTLLAHRSGKGYSDRPTAPGRGGKHPRRRLNIPSLSIPIET